MRVTEDVFRSAAALAWSGAEAIRLLEGADTEPPELHELLARLCEAADALGVFAPTDDVAEDQPVKFTDETTGWDFDPWTHEKASRAHSASYKARREWDELLDLVDRDSLAWTTLDDLEPHHAVKVARDLLLLHLGEAERMGSVIAQLILQRRLQAAATAYGRYGPGFSM